MEIPCKRDKKKNLKNLPMAINVGSSGLGIGGVVLVGGALVTAAIVSALAFRSKSQRRSSSENMKKNMSQSMDTQSVDVPNMLDEEVTSMKEILNNNSQSLAPDKKHDEQVHSGNTNEDIMDSVVSENQENTSIRVDSAFESEEQVVMAVQKDSCLERDDEGVASIEEYEAVNVPIKDTVGKASKNDDVIEDGEAHQEDAARMNQVNVEDLLHDEIIIENCEGDLIEETGHADQIVHELLTEEEAIDAARLLQIEVQKCPDGQDEIILENCEEDLSNKKGVADQILKETDQQMECSSKQVVADHQVAPDAQERQVNKNCEPFVVPCVMNQLKEAVGGQTTVNEDTPLSQLINNTEEDKETAQKVEKHVTIKDEAAKVEVTTEHELVKKNEIPHVEFVKEDEDSEEPTTEAKISNHKIEETPMLVKEEIITDHELIKIEEISHVESVKEDEDVEEDVTVKAELSCGINPPSVHEEPTPEAKINNHIIEETDVEVKGEMITDHELVKKDEIPHFESVNEDDDSEKDVTVKVKPSSGVSSSSVQEELTPEAKIGNHKIEENMEENQTTLGKNHNYSEEDVTLKANLGSGVSSPYVLEEPTLEAKVSNHNKEENTKENQTLLGENHKDNEEDVTAKVELSSGVNSSTMQDKPTPETKINDRKIEENMDVNQTILGKRHNDNNDNGVIKEQAFAREPWNLKLMAWPALISIWCLCHWYSELPFPELSLVGSLLFILILFGYRSRTTHLVKYE